MRRLVAIGGVVISLAARLQAGEVAPGLATLLAHAEPDQAVSTLVYLEPLDLNSLTNALDARRASRQERHARVVRALRAHAERGQKVLREKLNRARDQGAPIDFESFWITNALRVDAPPDVIRMIAERDDVRIIFENAPVERTRPIREPSPPGARGGPEPGLAAIRAPDAWGLGFSGSGVLIASLDTGVDATHPALADRWAGVANPQYAGHPEWAWFDIAGISPTQPIDPIAHGTHVTGILCGGAPGDAIGVAPGANWIAANNVVEANTALFIDDTLQAFQWVIDPDGDPATSWDVPHVCCNSWGIPVFFTYEPCLDVFWAPIDACEAAGIAMFFAGGNDGTLGLRIPADRATDDYRNCAVAAIEAESSGLWTTGFSARGPTYCTPDSEPFVKPNIGGPGRAVRSSVPGGSYEAYSGTSMAAPHVAGVAALVAEANPDLTVDEIKQALYDTALDLGVPGKDTYYGWGMVDAYAAVTRALELRELALLVPEGLPAVVDPAGVTEVRVVVTPRGSQPAPGTGLLHVHTGDGWTALTMNEAAPNEYVASFPMAPCGTSVAYYFSVETQAGEVVTLPYLGAAEPYEADVFAADVSYFLDEFETDLGWTVVAGADNGNWERGDPMETTSGPLNDPYIVQPELDASRDGTLCYVTGAGAGETAGSFDLDGGPTHLISPRFDLRQRDPVISYWRYFHISSAFDDEFIVSVSNDDGQTWTDVDVIDERSNWTHAQWRLSDYVAPTASVRVRFTADDSPNTSLEEAVIDDFRISERVCIAPVRGDLNCDDVANASDIDAFVLALLDPDTYGATFPACDMRRADLNADNLVNAGDIDSFVMAVIGS